jgi:aerobic-type carbon monoxide dehydrogenase small subunit (CoxS/CutS family)
MNDQKETVIKEKNEGISRRQFLVGTGLVLGGTALGSMAVLSACSGTTTTKYVDPYSGKQFDSLDALKTDLDQTRPESAVTLTTLKVNGTTYVLPNVASTWTLAQVLREHLGLTGTKTGCNRGECGTCTVIVNGKSVYSCLILATDADGAIIQTVEGLSDGINFTGYQKAIYDTDALQCGFCAPGFIMSATALLASNPKPTLDQVREALSGHICTCGNTKQYVEAVMQVSGENINGKCSNRSARIKRKDSYSQIDRATRLRRRSFPGEEIDSPNSSFHHCQRQGGQH